MLSRLPAESNMLGEEVGRSLDVYAGFFKQCLIHYSLIHDSKFRAYMTLEEVKSVIH